MRFQDQLNFKLKAAMREKNKVALESLRAIKSAILLLQTQSGVQGFSAFKPVPGTPHTLYHLLPEGQLRLAFRPKIERASQGKVGARSSG